MKDLQLSIATLGVVAILTLLVWTGQDATALIMTVFFAAGGIINEFRIQSEATRREIRAQGDSMRRALHREDQ